jgi:hypothetical protein
VRTELFLAASATAERRQAIREAFRDNGVEVSREGRPALKSFDILDLRIDVAFLIGTTVGGVIWDAEKELLKRGIAAARAVWAASGTVTLDLEAEPRERPPTVYLVPDGADGDNALAAIEADYETAPPSIRVWLPRVGWIDSRDLARIRSEAKRLIDNGDG